MNTLHDLPNISTVIERKLRQAGVDTPEQLLGLGGQQAFARIKLQDPTACLNMLYALEGAIQGVRWHHLNDETKKELRAFFQSL